MTGPEHYQEAEVLLAEAVDLDERDTSAILQAAQVHATLAVAAATVMPLVSQGEERPWDLPMSWARVIS